MHSALYQSLISILNYNEFSEQKIGVTHHEYNRFLAIQITHIHRFNKKFLWKFNFQIASFYFEFDETCKLVKIGENQFESYLFHKEIFLLKIFRCFFRVSRTARLFFYLNFILHLWFSFKLIEMIVNTLKDQSKNALDFVVRYLFIYSAWIGHKSTKSWRQPSPKMRKNG